jgi:hypothetical protein
MNVPGTDDASASGRHPGPATAGSRLIAALRAPEAYPHPVESPIRVQETHISWVLLTGPYAYKVKKPLALSFLDYSTLERRRFFCEEELRLNRRCAPGLYLEAVPIGGTVDAPRIGDATGPALEYAVRMLQFDTREELDQLVAAGLVAADEVRQLGHDVAMFHALAAHAPADSPFGTPTRLHGVTRDNFAELERLHPAGIDTARVASLKEFSDSTFQAVESVMAGRRGAGWVRECHGDLHCANVVRWRGRLTPFDGIEFDPGLRYVDVVSDIAFLAMDLGVRGRNDLRLAALNAWAAGLGDYAGLALLPYYENYRALVRAKVAAMRASQAAAGSAARHAAVAEISRYLDWANARSCRPKPRLLLTCGLSGSGKTWLAERLAAAIGAIHVRSDVERKRLAGIAPLASSRSPPDAGIYTPDFNERTYRRLAECAGSCLQSGESIIVDAAFLRRHERRAMLDEAAAHGADGLILHCTAPLDELKRRVAARRSAMNDASEADVALLDRQPSYWEPLDEAERRSTITVDTTRPQVLQSVLAAVHPGAA